MPKQPLGMTTWATLYNNGFVFGVDGPGPRENNALTAVNQLKIITIGNSQFRVRLPTALGPNFDLSKALLANTGAVASWAPNYRTHDAYDNLQDLSGSEWNDLLAKMVSWTAPSIRGSRFSRLDLQLAWMGQAGWPGMISDGLFQEALIGNYMPSRGYFSGASYHPGAANSVARNTSLYWRPVLELIQ
jgi:hypothetical protein